MDYMTCNDAQKLFKVSTRRVQQMCKNGEIAGAVKMGKSWMIPNDTILGENTPEYGVSNNRPKPLPIGVSDFRKATTDYYYVDKTLLIRDILDRKSEVTLFTRPRRFGKTLNMDMLRVFFEKTAQNTSVYFRSKDIWKCGKEYTSHQGKYPVIFLTFKDIKCSSWEMTLEKITRLIALEFMRHSELEGSSRLTTYEKELFVKFARGQASEVENQMSLQYLSLMLRKHHNEKVIIIIDEYDTPIQQGHTTGFYNQTTTFMRNFFSCGLKDNENLAFGFLTGILRVAKESIFSGMNNLKISSILDKEYSPYFGFTKAEVKDMLHYYHADDRFREVCKWYDGYLFGDTEIFNPWSLINYISDQCEPKAFWQSTGSNEIIGEVIAEASGDTIESLHRLLNGETITTYIDTNVIYPEIRKSPYSIFSFLLVAGYLKVSKAYSPNIAPNMYDVSIPNKEIAFVYEKEIVEKHDYTNVAISFQQAIATQNTDRLQSILEHFMLDSVSFYDAGSESFYHGMLLGLCAIVSSRYHVRSNGESGLGRFDICLEPKTNGLPPFVFEFKHAKSDSEDLEALAQEALSQIRDMRYDSSMKARGHEGTIGIGIAFRGKQAVVKRS